MLKFRANFMQYILNWVCGLTHPRSVEETNTTTCTYLGWYPPPPTTTTYLGRYPPHIPHIWVGTPPPIYHIYGSVPPPPPPTPSMPLWCIMLGNLSWCCEVLEFLQCSRIERSMCIIPIHFYFTELKTSNNKERVYKMKGVGFFIHVHLFFYFHIYNIATLHLIKTRCSRNKRSMCILFN